MSIGAHGIHDRGLIGARFSLDFTWLVLTLIRLREDMCSPSLKPTSLSAHVLPDSGVVLTALKTALTGARKSLDTRIGARVMKDVRTVCSPCVRPVNTCSHRIGLDDRCSQPYQTT